MSTVQSKLYRIFTICAVLLVLAGMAAPAKAAAAPSFSIIKVVKDESITVRTYNFPAATLFTIRMDVVGNAAVNGIIVTQTNTGAGGSFEETYRIPAELRGKTQIAVRMEANGYYAVNWFNNSGSSTPPDNNNIPVTGGSGSPGIKIVAVEKDRNITIEATRFPANVDFKIRIGPFYNFWKSHEVTGTINSGSGGTFRFSVSLPDAVKGVSLVAVRLDSLTGGYYAYNAFTNNTSGTYTPGSTVNTCSLVSVSPAASIKPGAEFDAVWKVKNTSSKSWRSDQVDYRYLSGSKLYKYDSRYDLFETVDPDETVKIVVDMKAPSQTGWYTTTWGLVVGGTTLCQMPLTFQVK